MEWLGEIIWARPWGVALLPLGVYVVYTFHKHPQQQDAAHLFSQALLQYLSTPLSQKKGRLLRVGNYLCVLFLAISLCGPSITGRDQTSFKMNRGAVFVFDLSLSMLATDLPPNRLTQAKFMLADILKGVPDVDSGLILYANHAYPIVPITQSHSLLNDQIPLLHPDLMPGSGSQPIPAIQLAANMLTQSGYLTGDIIWITDDVNQADAQLSKDIHPHTLSALVFGSPSGATIRLSDQSLLKSPSGQAVLHTVPAEKVSVLSNLVSGVVHQIQHTQKPPTTLLEHLQRTQKHAASSADAIQRPKTDLGVFFLIPVLLLVLAASYQRAKPLYFGSTLLITLVFLPISSRPLSASTAVEQVDDPRWKAHALIQSGKCAAAISLLQTFEDSISQYNLGICYSEEKNFDDALQAFENALSLQPDFIEAEENRQALLAFLQNQQGDKKGKQGNEQANSDGNSQSQSASQNKDDTSPDSNQMSDQQASDDRMQSNEQKQSNSQSFADASQSANRHRQNNTEKEEQTNKQLAHHRQAEYINALINRVPDEPAFLLKRRIQIMHQEKIKSSQQPISNNSQEQW
jgi:Ca-activated chloride channel family protein